MQARHTVRVVFGEHMKPDRIESMVTALKTAGDVAGNPDGRTFLVETKREAHFIDLRKTLHGWELWGFVWWEEVA